MNLSPPVHSKVHLLKFLQLSIKDAGSLSSAAVPQSQYLSLEHVKEEFKGGLLNVFRVIICTLH